MVKDTCCRRSSIQIASSPLAGASDIEELVERVRSSDSVRRKAPLPEVIARLRLPLDPSVVVWEGEDAAVLDTGADELLLVALDSIMDSLVASSPRFAGFAAVAVNVNDIVAMGGRPVAALDLLAYREEEVLDQILDGLREGALKYGVGIVGGHLAPESEADHVAVAVIGSVARRNLMRSDGASPGDILLLAYEEQGVPVAGVAWHSADALDRVQLRARHDGIRVVGDRVKACKDVSNGGILMAASAMAEASRCAVLVDLDRMHPPGDETTPAWVGYHLGCGFLFAIGEEEVAGVEQTLQDAGLRTEIIGEFSDGTEVTCSWQGRSASLFDWGIEPIILPRPIALRKDGSD